MRVLLSLTSLEELVLLCDMKNLKVLLYFTRCHFSLSGILLFGCGNLMVSIQLSPCINFYVFFFWGGGGVKTNLSNSVWVLKIPLKNKFFLWMTFHNKILTKDNLCKRGWVGGSSCIFYTNSESVDYLFFHCPFILDFWSKILTSHSQGRQICVSSILTFWNSYVPLFNF
jgi:zinc-binding in reverse transcriptase